MRAATGGREPDSVKTAAKCLLALFAPNNPNHQQIAAAHILAFGLVDLHDTAERLKG